MVYMPNFRRSYKGKLNIYELTNIFASMPENYKKTRFKEENKHLIEQKLQYYKEFLIEFKEELF